MLKFCVRMPANATALCLLIFALLPAVVLAERHSQVNENIFSNDAPSAEELEGAEEIPLELDPVEVTGSDLNFNQEVALRIVRQAYNSPRSDRHEDRDKWVCWLEKPTGTSFNYLGCARNGDIWALRPSAMPGSPASNFRPTRTAGYGTIMRSTRPVNQWKLEQALASLPGSGDFDEEFTTMVMLGERPPRDIPNNEEVDQFAKAWIATEELQKAGRPEEDQILAIKAEGLTLKRYNRIAELTEIFQSVENEVDSRINQLR